MNRNNYRNYSVIIVLVGLIFALAAGVLAANQVKTTETFITSGDGAVSSAASSAFSLYIGDNLTGVSSPVKSAQVAVSGVYTGNGTIAVQVDSGTTQTFTLANVGSTPTPFEVLYDASTTISTLTSAGTYTYTLHATPAGVVIYGFSAKLVESREYVPPSCADGNPDNEKVKTTETLITSGDSSVSSATSSAFSLYIGDNLTGVSNPVKSAQVAVSGVYTGNGTIAVQVDSGTTQTFTLANVGSTLTPFEVLYDASTTISTLTSAGTYTYTLYATPSGVTIYGFSAKLVETHRYKPPACGGGYAITGNLESSTFDTGVSTGAAYNSIMWAGQLGAGEIGKVKLQLATDAEGDGPWTYRGSDCAIGTFYEAASSTPMEIGCPSFHNNKRYFRYKVTICSANNCSSQGATTPQVNNVVVNWSP